MKKSFLLIPLFSVLILTTGNTFAADTKEVTITGDGACAKCVLHQTEACQTAITTTENGKKVVYYLAENEVGKDFHENVCKASVKVSAKGTVTVKDGKNVLTASKIEAVK
jgi:hypothetical protein